MAARNRCCYHRHSSNVALSLGRLLMYNKSLCKEGSWVVSFSNLGSPCLHGDLLYSSPGARAQRHISTVLVVNCHFTMKERWWRLFFPKLCVRIKDNNNSPHGKFHQVGTKPGVGHGLGHGVGHGLPVVNFPKNQNNWPNGNKKPK